MDDVGGFAAHAGNAVRAASRPLSVLGLSLLAACQSIPSAQPAAAATRPPGQAFAEASCSLCHATGLYGTSPNPNAPPIGGIANHEGVTEQTLSYWLRSAHNYPMMNFLLNDDEADALVVYFLSLRRADDQRPAA